MSALHRLGFWLCVLPDTVHTYNTLLSGISIIMCRFSAGETGLWYWTNTLWRGFRAPLTGCPLFEKHCSR